MKEQPIKLHTFKTTWFTFRRALTRAVNCYRPRAAYQHKLDYWNNAVYRERIKQVRFDDLSRFFTPQPQKNPIIKPIDILLPVYNGYDFLRPCLDSLLKYTDLPFHIYIADDKSPDGRVLPLLRDYQTAHPDKITLVENKQNQGVLKTNNDLISRTQNDFILLNSDTEVPPEWASRLFAPIFEDASIAAAGPWSNASSTQSVGFLAKEGSLDLPLNEANRLAGQFTQNTLYSMPYLTSFCLAVRREAVKKIGGMDPVYGRGYYEETDWMERLRRHGYKTVLAPRVFVYHKGTASFSSVQKKNLSKKNLRIFNERYPNHSQEFKAALFHPEYIAAHFILLAKCIRASATDLKLLPHETPTGARRFTWKKEKDSFIYELAENGQYEALCTQTPPEQMEIFTNPLSDK